MPMPVQVPIVEGLADEFINGLRALSGNINVSQQAFGHLALRRVGGAQN
jgi:hypothetical protein